MMAALLVLLSPCLADIPVPGPQPRPPLRNERTDDLPPPRLPPSTPPAWVLGVVALASVGCGAGAILLLRRRSDGPYD